MPQTPFPIAKVQPGGTSQVKRQIETGFTGSVYARYMRTSILDGEEVSCRYAAPVRKRILNYRESIEPQI